MPMCNMSHSYILCIILCIISTIFPSIYLSISILDRFPAQLPGPGLKVTLESRICALGPGGRLAVELLLGRPLKGKAPKWPWPWRSS